MEKTRYTIDPIPFDDRMRHLALEMKRHGLPWSPQVGYFVWDHQGVISMPSPFPNQIYFILSMKRFLDLFGSVESMCEQLVWLPTGYQAEQLHRHLAANEPPSGRQTIVDVTADAAEALVQRYRCILACLKRPVTDAAAGRQSVDAGGFNAWIRRIMEADVGDLNRFPDAVERLIERIYRDVATAYLGWRRIQERRPDDWLPPERHFDPVLLDELGHFYSDYQRSVRALKRIRRSAGLLRTVDPTTAPQAYRQLVDRLVEGEAEIRSSQGIMETLTASEASSHPVS